MSYCIRSWRPGFLHAGLVASCLYFASYTASAAWKSMNYLLHCGCFRGPLKWNSLVFKYQMNLQKWSLSFLFRMNNSQCVDACQGFFKTKKDRDTFISKKRYLNVTQDGRSCTGARVAEKLGSDENFKPEHTLFCRELRFVAIYTLFLEIVGQKKCLFG